VRTILSAMQKRQSSCTGAMRSSQNRRPIPLTKGSLMPTGSTSPKWWSRTTISNRNWLDQKPGAKQRCHGPRRGVQDLLAAESADSGCLAVRGGAIGVTRPVRAAHPPSHSFGVAGKHAATGWPL